MPTEIFKKDKSRSSTSVTLSMVEELLKDSDSPLKSPDFKLLFNIYMTIVCQTT